MRHSLVAFARGFGGCAALFVPAGGSSAGIFIWGSSASTSSQASVNGPEDPRPRADGRGAISEEVRYLRGEVARLRRLVPGGASGNTPLGSPIGGRDFGGEVAVDASQSDGSFSVVSRAERSFNEAASRSRSRNVSPAVSVGSIWVFSFEVHFVLGGA